MVNLGTFLRRAFVVAFVVSVVGLPALMGFAAQEEDGLAALGVLLGLFVVLFWWGAAWVAWRVGVWLVRVWRGA